MRKILRDTCIFAALMILVIFTFSITVVGLTDEIKLVFEIFGLAFVLALFNYICPRKLWPPMANSCGWLRPPNVPLRFPAYKSFGPGLHRALW